jgi:nucleolin
MKARDAFEEIGEEEGELVTSGEENGDRETNYPTVVEPPEEAKVYIGNLPCDDVDSEGLTQLFKQGSVVEIMELRLLSLRLPLSI